MITNVRLAERAERETRNGGIAAFTAFVSRPEMIAAGVDVLNSMVGVWARDQLFNGTATMGNPRRTAHTGMRATIVFGGTIVRGGRYASGTGTFPATAYRMVLDRVEIRPFRLHIHTFFPELGQGSAIGSCQVKNVDGGGFSNYP